MNDLIEKLKNNKTAFGLMEPEEQECLRKVSPDNCVLYVMGRWGNAKNDDNEFGTDFTYAIKPDYQPEPEYVDLEIETHEGYLGVWRNQAQYFLPHRFTHLHCLPSLPGFEIFWYKCEGEKIQVYYECVASKTSEDQKVFAKFRR